MNHSIWKIVKVLIEIRAACHVQSDGLCYMWNHAERPLNIDVRLFLSYNIRKNIFCRV